MANSYLIATFLLKPGESKGRNAEILDVWVQPDGMFSFSPRTAGEDSWSAQVDEGAIQAAKQATAVYFEWWNKNVRPTLADDQEE